MATGTLLLGDGIHWDEPSVLMMGERYADKFLQDVYNVSTVKIATMSESLKVFVSASNLKIDCLLNSVNFSLYDVTGKQVNNSEIKALETKQFDLQKGIYILSVTDNSNTVVQKVIIP